jgi:rhodanese-related sulfurtransferase
MLCLLSGLAAALLAAGSGEGSASRPSATAPLISGHSSYVSPRAVQAACATNGDVVLVDVRPQPDFEAVHVPGSLNVPLFAVKTKLFLRDRSVVLIDAGHGARAVGEACCRLREAGFRSARVLSGGLNAWRRNGGRLQGAAQAVRQLDMLAPAEFLRMRSDADFVVVDVGADPNTEALRRLPECIWVPFDARPSEFGEQIESLAGGVNGFSTVVVCSDDAEDYARIRPALDKAPDMPVFYLSGGLRALEAYLSASAADGAGKTSARRANRVLKRARKPCGCW